VATQRPVADLRTALACGRWLCAVRWVVVREPDEVAALPRDLGRQLAERRKAAGLVRRELGMLVGCSRIAVASAETGHAQIGRSLWERADRVLGTGELFARGFDRIQAHASEPAQASAMLRSAGSGGRTEPAMAPSDPKSLTPDKARQACRDRSWPVEEDSDGRLWLASGTAIDALEVPRVAGMAALAWWAVHPGGSR
jgi:transcriptional regulator with XRE-family HTH domain